MNKRIVRRSLLGVLALVLVLSGGFGLKTLWDYDQEAAIYESAQETFLTIAEPEVPLAELPAMDSIAIPEEEAVMPEAVVDNTVPHVNVDFEGLSAASSDSIGWLHMPNTNISYPLVQGDNNQEYVDAAYNGNYASAGSIFIDYRVPDDFSAQNTVIYGHNMKNDTMFGTLQNYQDDGTFAAANPYFFILTDDGYFRYELCYALFTDATSSVYDYDFSASGSYSAHLSMLSRYSMYDTGVELTTDDQIVTLSTCTGYTETHRFVVIGKLLEFVSNEPVVDGELDAEITQ